MSSSEVYASYETAREAYENAVDIYLSTQGRDMNAKAAAAGALEVAYKSLLATIAALQVTERTMSLHPTYQTAREAYLSASAAYAQAGDVLGMARKAHTKARIDVTEACRAYEVAGNAFTKARKAYLAVKDALT
jgi:hypothetical protein